VLAGFVAAGLLMQRDFARKGAPADLAWWIVAAGMLGGLAGARVHLALTHWHLFAQAPLAFLFAPAGLVWYGGLAGGVLATWIPIRAAGVPWLRAADTAAPALALGLAIGRIGCHLAGDGDWGVPTGLPWGVAYLDAIAGWPHPPGVRVHPAPLYEMTALLALTAWLWRIRTRVRPDGAVFFRYLGLAGAIRFAVELVRTNPAVALGLSEAQWTSLALMAASAVWLARQRRAAGAASR
jgi:phosphatidylglycerol:prolipoprotein diacylglycerol transferase